MDKEILKLDASEDSGKLRRRPSLPGSAKVTEEKKISTVFTNRSDPAFAEVLLHFLPHDQDENRRNVNLPQNNSSYGPAVLLNHCLCSLSVCFILQKA